MTSNTQREFPYKRSQRFALLDAIDPASLEPSLGRRRWAPVVELLKQIEFCSGRGECRAYTQTLAGRMRDGAGVSVDTVQRAAKLAKQLGLLVVEARVGRQGRESNAWRVQWDRVAALAKSVDPATIDERLDEAPTPLDEVPRAVRCLAGERVGSAARSGRGLPHEAVGDYRIKRGGMPHDAGGLPHEAASLNRNNQSSTSYQPPPSPSVVATNDEATGWGRVVEEIEAEGVGCAADAAAAIRSAGGTPGDAMAIIDAYREGLEPQPPAWKPGALFHRMTHWRRGQDPREGWPQPDDDHVVACERIKADNRRRDADRESIRLREHRSSKHAARRVEQGKLAKLEAAARALPRHELEKLIGSIDEPFIRNEARRNPFGVASLTAIADGLGCDDLVTNCPRGSPSSN
ncbi:hypothetical protein [Botrimarina mediterranea]|uniref:Uncharacterized protein n=1 Tax=Botrimarina mediterranea TaxID=2528022 RepID=A0A518K900_9BACT|nr:hypothetical protein [Botrimarina mediterranea]QDV74278.1 hypothetical protein Spa11_24790 [Botrimarina mediterranea]